MKYKKPKKQTTKKPNKQLLNTTVYTFDMKKKKNSLYHFQ